MARDIVSEAVEQAEAMKKAAYENAKSVLVDAMSTNLKQAVTEAIDEKIDEDVDETSEEIQDEITTPDTDSASIAEAGVEDDEELELEASIQEEDDDEDDNIDVDIIVDDDDDDEEDDDDIDEVIEIVDEIDMDEDEDEEEIADDAYDVDDDDDVDNVDELEEEDDDDWGGKKGDESKSRRDYESTVRENKQLRRENKRYEKALTFLKGRIDEVNLFNSRLAAAQDVMRKVSLTKTEKEAVVESFDGCRTVGEVKRTFKVLTEAYKGTSKIVIKNRAERPNVQSVISEENKTESSYGFNRMAELAGLK